MSMRKIFFSILLITIFASIYSASFYAIKNWTPENACAMKTQAHKTQGGSIEESSPAREFTATQAVILLKRIENNRCYAEYTAGINKAWDILFKATILIISITGSGVTAYVASLKKEEMIASKYVLVASATITSAIGLLGTFAATTLDFSKRQDVWEQKQIALSGCALMLQMGDPKRSPFIKNLVEIERWNDSTAKSELTTSCTGDQIPANITAISQQMSPHVGIINFQSPAAVPSNSATVNGGVHSSPSNTTSTKEQRVINLR